MMYFAVTDENKYMIFGYNNEQVYNFKTNRVESWQQSPRAKKVFKNCIIKYNKSIKNEITVPCLLQYNFNDDQGVPYYTCLLISIRDRFTGTGIFLTHNDKNLIGKISYVIPLDRCRQINCVKIEGNYNW